MNSPARVSREQKWLRRIAVTLLALAMLAQRAAGRSLPVRTVTLWLLRRAEPVARDFAAAHGVVIAPLVLTRAPFYRSENAPEDALRLAEQFCVLAEIFTALAFEAVPQAYPGSRASTRRRRLADRGLIASRANAFIGDMLRPAYADTS